MSICQNCPLQEGGPHLYHIYQEDGWVRIREHQVFPGIWLAFKDAHTFAFSHHAAYPGCLLEITHCREGRLEYEDHCRSFFLGEGDLSIHESSCQGAVLRCPVKCFHGLSLIIHPEQAPSCTSCFLGGVDVQLPELKRRFCGGEGHYVDRAPAELAKVFTQLYQAPDKMREGYYKVKVLELLLLLSQLEPGAGPSAERSATPAQAALAREVIAYIDAHRGSRITVEQLAQALHATPEQLRYSVGRVYGKPLYQCVRAYKMRVAGRLLRETGRTVMDVAAELGYENGSKFSSAFRDVMGVSPGEYRRTTQEGDFPSLEQ